MSGKARHKTARSHRPPPDARKGQVAKEPWFAVGGFGIRPAARLALAVSLAAACLYLVGHAIGPLAALEGSLLDLRFRLRGPIDPHTHVAVVTIDPIDEVELGGAPVDRRYLGRAIDAISAAGARVIVLDMMLDRTQQPLPVSVQRTLQAALDEGLVADPNDRKSIADRLIDRADRQLARAIERSGRVVLPYRFVEDPEGKPQPLPRDVTSTALTRVTGGGRVAGSGLDPARVEAEVPIPLLVDAADAMAHVNWPRGAPVAGNVPYREQLLVAHDGALYPTLPLVAAAGYLELSPRAVEVAVGQSITIGELGIPVDGWSRLVLDFYGPGDSLVTVPLREVLSGKVPDGAFAGRAVVIGRSGLSDPAATKTPFGDSQAPVMRTATALANILDERHLLQRDWVRAIDLLAIVTLGVLAGVAATLSPIRRAGYLIGWMVSGWLAISFAAFALAGVWLNAVLPLLAMGGATVAVALARWRGHVRRKVAEATALAHDFERFELAARGSHDGLWDWDIKSGRIFFSPLSWEMVGQSNPAGDDPTIDLDGWLDLVDPRDRGPMKRALEAHLSGRTGHFHKEYRVFGGEGAKRWILVRGLVQRNPGTGMAVRVAGTLTDVTERRRAEAQLREDAFSDRLTGLANRALLIDRMGRAAERMSLGRGQAMAILSIDIDRFRLLNDSLGRAAGERLLIVVARRLQAMARPGDTVARVGGDEFAMIFEHVDSVFAAQSMAESMVEALSLPQRFHGKEMVLTTSIGVRFVADAADAGGAEGLLRDASLARYQAKDQGGGRAVMFDPGMRDVVRKRWDLENELRGALASGEQIHVVYQPILNLKSRRLVGFEALARWHHPDRGVIMPGDFIPVAEESGMIVDIGRLTLKMATAQLADWKRRGADQGLTVAVNVAGRQFNESDLLGDVAEALKLSGLDPAGLKIEVTESMVMQNPEATRDVLAQLIDQGIGISIDDFGTGYSSLAYLTQFPFNVLKIDRSFVTRMDASVEDRVIVRAISGLAHALGRTVLAEGVEREQQAVALAEHGVELGQGYLFDRPLSVGQAASRILPDATAAAAAE